VLVTRIGFFAAALSIGTILASVTVPSYAQDDIRKRGDIACKASTNKLCSKYFGQGDMVILACLQQKKSHLAPSCRKFLTEIGQLQ